MSSPSLEGVPGVKQPKGTGQHGINQCLAEGLGDGDSNRI